MAEEKTSVQSGRDDDNRSDTGGKPITSEQSKPTKKAEKPKKKWDAKKKYRLKNISNVTRHIVSPWGNFYFAPGEQRDDIPEPVLHQASYKDNQNFFSRPQPVDGSK